MEYVFPVVFLLAIFLYVYYWKKHKAMFETLCREIGASEAGATWIPPTTRAMWHGRAIVLRMTKLGKRGPHAAIVDISAASPARAIVRRSSRFLNTISLFGPPRVELPGLVDHAVRSDDMMLAQKIFSDAQLPALIANTIVHDYDVLELSEKRVRVRRVALSGSDDDELEAAREAWPLAAAVVERLGLPPAG